MSKVILGGGVSGLSAAYYLRKKFPNDKILLLEATSRTGGWIKSQLQSNGLIFEQGPRTIRPNGTGINTLELLEELNLESQIKPISSQHPAALNRMIYVDGKLHSLPVSLLSIFKKQTPFSKPIANYVFNDLKAPRKLIPEQDESIYSFVERRFGKEIADYAISPMICGICAGNAEKISVKFLMENMFNYEQMYGSVLKGAIYSLFNKKSNQQSYSNLQLRAKKEKWNVYTLNDGLEILPKYLTNHIVDAGVEIKLNSSCKSIELKNDQLSLEMQDGSQIKTDHLISSIPANLLGNIIKGHPTLSAQLNSIPFVNVCVINLYYDKKVLKTEGFGVLVPPKENIPILGVIFDSCVRENENTTLTVMMGGYWFNNQFGDNPTTKQLLNTALHYIKTLLNIEQKPSMYAVNVLRNCIAQYVVGHKKNVFEINDYILQKKLPISLCGASYYGVGLNDAILSARTVVENLKTI